jgi:hypothetical protein
VTTCLPGLSGASLLLLGKIGVILLRSEGVKAGFKIKHAAKHTPHTKKHSSMDRLRDPRL